MQNEHFYMKSRNFIEFTQFYIKIIFCEKSRLWGPPGAGLAGRAQGRWGAARAREGWGAAGGGEGGWGWGWTGAQGRCAPATSGAPPHSYHRQVAYVV